MPDINANIIEYLNQFLAIEKPNYAVLLKGAWGCGKTWFINEFVRQYDKSMKNLDNKSKSRFLKLSLNGISSPDAIDRRLFFALHQKLDGQYTDLFAHLASGIFAIAKVDSLFKPFKIKDFIHAINGKVLIFDDLERCCMPVSETLGYLNDFIERMGLHVIIIANELEISKIENAAGEERITKFDIIKEKVIGKRFEIDHDISSVLQNFVGKLSSESTKKILFSKMQIIIDIFNKSETKNLRILLHALIEFDRVYKKLTDEQIKNNQVSEKLLSTFLCFKFDIDKARIVPKDIEGIEAFRLHEIMSSRNKEKQNPPAIAKSFKRYHWLDAYHTVLSPSAWYNLFEKGFLSEDKIRECIENSGLLPQSQSPLVALWYWSDLEDDELQKLVSDCFTALQEGAIKSPFAILHLAGILIRLSGHEVIPFAKDHLIKIFNESIDVLANSNTLEYASPSDLRSNHACWGSLQFQATETKEFQIICKHMIDILINIDKSEMLKAAKMLPKLMLDDMASFINSITYNSEKQLYYKKPIFCYVDAKDFSISITKLSNKLIWEPFRALEERYNFIYNASILSNEIDFLITLDGQMTEYINANKGKNSTLQLQAAQKKHLKKAIETITEFNKSPPQGRNLNHSDLSDDDFIG